MNARNLYLLNNPGSHDSEGVEVTAVNTLLQNSTFRSPLDIPLAYIGPEAAGQTITVRLYSIADSGAAATSQSSTLTLSLSRQMQAIRWDMIQLQPIGPWPLPSPGKMTPMAWLKVCAVCPAAVKRSGSSQLISSQFPGDLSSCDWQNPTPETCTPFHGGHLMVRYDGGFYDTYAWELPSIQGDISDNSTAGCTVFPIAMSETARSTTNSDYPDAGEFSYPPSPPAYANFMNHQPDVPLANATPGDVYLVQNGFGPSDFGWLAWNEGIVANATTLGNRLSWPGNTLDYNDYSDAGTAVPGSGFNHVVRGYVETGDPSDQDLHVADWLLAYTGTVNDTAVTDQLNEHIDYGRTLRLPISNTNNGTQYQVSQFGIFRLLGYNITENWLLLEFVNFDTSCGQLPVAPNSVAVAGPTEGLSDTSYAFIATVSPTNTATPVTYTWEITDHDTVTNTDGISNTIMLDWSSAGSKTVSVTAVNSSGLSVNQSHIIDITVPDVTPPDKLLYLPLVSNNSSD